MGHVVRSSIVLAAILLAGACGSPDDDAGTTDILYLRSSGRVTILRAGADSPSFTDRRAVPSGNWKTVVSADRVGDSTLVTATESATGTELWSRSAPDALQAKVVSGDGNLVVLGPRGERPYGSGRAKTRLVIAGKDSSATREIVLQGNYEPEAFSIDGDSLFVVRYLPANAPTRYQVRRFDLTTARVHLVYTPHDEIQKSMGGTARIQVQSDDGERLYTLYTVGGSKGSHRHAFIHVLDLEEEWAHCIDLPPGFAEAAESATALTASPDGTKLYVANTNAAALAEVDTKQLQVTRATTRSFGRGIAHAAADEDETIYVGSDRYVTAIDRSDLAERWKVLVPERVGGLQVSADGHKIYVGMRHRIASLDSTSGVAIEMMDPAGIERIQQFGPVLRGPAEPDSITKCAC